MTVMTERDALELARERFVAKLALESQRLVALGEFESERQDWLLRCIANIDYKLEMSS